jgi:hypothetical protein
VDVKLNSTAAVWPPRGDPTVNQFLRLCRAPHHRKNWTFDGTHSSSESAATMYTSIETAKLKGLDPEAYLRTLIVRIADHPAKRIGELLP